MDLNKISDQSSICFGMHTISSQCWVERIRWNDKHIIFWSNFFFFLLTFDAFSSWLFCAAHIFTNIWSSNSKIEGIPSRLLHICCIYPLLWESTIIVKWIWAQAPSALQSLNTNATWSRQFRTIARGSTLT